LRQALSNLRRQMQLIIRVFVVAVLLNYAWELAQAPLYVGLENYNPGVFWHCFVASLGDGIMLLLIVAAGWITLRQPDWFVHPGVRGYLVMVTAGLLLAVLVEWVAVHRLGRWAYAERMPTISGIGIGLSHCANADSSADDIPHSGRYRIKKEVDHHSLKWFCDSTQGGASIVRVKRADGLTSD
jgi:hypothetical protein